MGVAEEIGRQMGGIRRLKLMLGGKVQAITNGLSIQWPNKQRTKGNYVEVILRGDDTYDMTFYNKTPKAQKKVKDYTTFINEINILKVLVSV